MHKNYLAIDIGASSGRHIVGWMENGVLRTEEVYRFPNSVRRVDGHLEWDIDSLFAHVKQGIPYERRDSHGARRDRRSPGCARTPEELMADMDKALSLWPGSG